MVNTQGSLTKQVIETLATKTISSERNGLCFLSLVSLIVFLSAENSLQKGLYYNHCRYISSREQLAPALSGQSWKTRAIQVSLRLRFGQKRFFPPKQTVLYASEQKFNLCLKFGLPSDLSGPLWNVDKSAIFAHFWTKKGPYFHFGPCFIGCFQRLKWLYLAQPGKCQGQKIVLISVDKGYGLLCTLSQEVLQNFGPDTDVAERNQCFSTLT